MHARYHKLKRLGYWIGIPLILLLTLCWVEHRFHLRVIPPENLKTLSDFKTWQAGSIRGWGTYETSSQKLTVMCGPYWSLLPSGPAAYLFDETGHFVDWTPDMGDALTEKYRYDLSSGNFKNYKPENP